MANSRRALCQLGTTLLFAGAMLMIAVGVVDAQVPNMLCAAPTKFGCVGMACMAAQNTCNNEAWDGQEIESFNFRKCNGAAGACTGGVTNFTTCESAFIPKSGTKPVERRDAPS